MFCAFPCFGVMHALVSCGAAFRPYILQAAAAKAAAAKAAEVAAAQAAAAQAAATQAQAGTLAA